MAPQNRLHQHRHRSRFGKTGFRFGLDSLWSGGGGCGKLRGGEASCPTSASIVALIPTIGPFLAVVALLVVLKYYSNADLWPDLILVCVVSRVIAAVVAGLLVGLAV